MSLTLEGEEIRVSFSYDPELVWRVKEVPGRRYDPKSYAWYVPKHQVKALLTAFKDVPVKLGFDPADLEPPRPEPVQSVKGFTAELYPFQSMGVGFLLTRRNGLLADEMGLGKTVEAIAAAVELRNRGLINRVLVLCPKTIILQWATEYRRFTGDLATIVTGNREERSEAIRKAQFLVVTNYETVLHDAEKLASLKPDLVILDEAQRIGTYDAKTTKQIKTYLKPTYRWALTGTPLENSLTELHSIMQWIDPGILGSFWDFRRYLVYGGYRGRQIVGTRDLEELHNQIAPWMLRRRKREVLTDLPPVTINNYSISLGKEESKVYATIRKSLEHYYRLYRSTKGTEGGDQILAQLTYLRECCDSLSLVADDKDESSKLTELAEIVADLPDEKIVIFTEWERMLRLVAAELRGLKHQELYGQMTQQQRGESIKAFWEDPGCRLFLSTEAGGLGVNLQCASTIINVELHWNPARLQQRIGRLHRIGQKGTVTCINLVAKDTIEERVLSVVNEKTSLFRKVVDGDFGAEPEQSGAMGLLAREFAATTTVWGDAHPGGL